MFIKQTLWSFLCCINYSIQSSDNNCYLSRFTSYLGYSKSCSFFKECLFLSKKAVSARTSILADDGNCPLPFFSNKLESKVRTFLFTTKVKRPYGTYTLSCLLNNILEQLSQYTSSLHFVA